MRNPDNGRLVKSKATIICVVKKNFSSFKTDRLLEFASHHNQLQYGPRCPENSRTVTNISS